MTTLRSIALVSEEEVFAIYSYNTFAQKYEWENMINSPEIIEIPDDIPYFEKGLYSNGVFTPSSDIVAEAPVSGKGFAFISNGEVFTTIYPEAYPDELKERLLNGLEKSAIVVEIPENKYVFQGDLWNGTEFIEKTV
jgi:hypothetical protein